MPESADSIDFTFTILVEGIPDGESVSGNNTYPGLTRIYNTGWSYTDYTYSGTTYRRATKTQTLRYARESDSAYTTTKHMYFNMTFSTGTLSTDTPMYITIEAKQSIINIPILAGIIKRTINKKKKYTSIR